MQEAARKAVIYQQSYAGRTTAAAAAAANPAFQAPVPIQGGFYGNGGGQMPGWSGAPVLQRPGDGPARVHIDIHTSDREAEVARLSALGATMVDDGEHWAIMRDPAGLVFCVIPDEALNESNATAWD